MAAPCTPTTPAGSPTWGHYKNIHMKLLEAAKKDRLQEFFAEPVCVTEKIDGSNLGCHIRKIVGADEEWELVCLMGRNQPIWDQANPRTLDQVPKYGNAGNLAKLPLDMKAFCVRTAKMLNVDELIVFGEAYRCGQEQQCASWHPFGYKTRNAADGEGDSETEGGDGFTLTRLTTATHALFSKACLLSHPQPQTHAELQTLLKTKGAKEHLIFPPPLAFVGPLVAAVDALHPVLIREAQDPTYEGTFVAFDNGSGGFKWKTGTYDEQPAVPTLADVQGAIPTHCNAKNVDLTTELSAYVKLLEVYNTSGKKSSGPRFPKEKQAKFENPAEVAVLKDLAVAADREMSKMPSIEGVPKKSRKPIAADMVAAVVRECLIQYEEAGVEPPYTNADLDKHAPAAVLKVVMAVPFVEAGSS